MYSLVFFFFFFFFFYCNLIKHIGNISNSLNIKSEPIISNKDEIIKLNGNNNDFITNPTKINLIKGSSHISIYSGDLISEMFSCN